MSARRASIVPRGRVAGNAGSADTGVLPHIARAALGLSAIIFSSLAPGCIMGRQHPAATQPATAADPKTMESGYWYAQPAVASVTAHSFDRLWNACREVAEADGYIIDRTDYREGLLTTYPLVSKQAFELWRRDVQDPHGVAQSTLGTIRRTLRFEIRRNDDGTFHMTPKVIVERYASVERRITSVVQYRDVFSIRLLDINREAEAGTPVPGAYWYCIARDNPLEKKLAEDVNARLHP